MADVSPTPRTDHERTGFDKKLPRGSASAPVPDAVMLIIAVVATVLGALVLAHVISAQSSETNRTSERSTDRHTPPATVVDAHVEAIASLRGVVRTIDTLLPPDRRCDAGRYSSLDKSRKATTSSVTSARALAPKLTVKAERDSRSWRSSRSSAPTTRT